MSRNNRRPKDTKSERITNGKQLIGCKAAVADV